MTAAASQVMTASLLLCAQPLWQALEAVIPDVRKRTEVELIASPITHVRAPPSPPAATRRCSKCGAAVDARLSTAVAKAAPTPAGALREAAPGQLWPRACAGDLARAGELRLWPLSLRRQHLPRNRCAPPQRMKKVRRECCKNV